MRLSPLTGIGLLLYLGQSGWAQQTGAVGAGVFADVPANHWALDAVNQLAAQGLFTGYPDATFRGDRAMTRYEVAAALSRLISDQFTRDPTPRFLLWIYPEPGTRPRVFRDVPADHWAYGPVNYWMANSGLFAGYPDGSFRGDQVMTHAEFAVLIAHMERDIDRFLDLVLRSLGKPRSDAAPLPDPASHGESVSRRMDFGTNPMRSAVSGDRCWVGGSADSR